MVSALRSVGLGAPLGAQRTAWRPAAAPSPAPSAGNWSQRPALRRLSVHAQASKVSVWARWHARWLPLLAAGGSGGTSGGGWLAASRVPGLAAGIR